MSDVERKQLAFLIADFLKQEIGSSKTDSEQKESLEVALQCLETTYAFEIDSTEDRKSLDVTKGKGLLDLFQSQAKQQDLKVCMYSIIEYLIFIV